MTDNKTPENSSFTGPHVNLARNGQRQRYWSKSVRLLQMSSTSVSLMETVHRTILPALLRSVLSALVFNVD